MEVNSPQAAEPTRILIYQETVNYHEDLCGEDKDIILVD